MTADSPPGVDPALWAEFQRIADEVHRLMRAGEPEREGAPAPLKLVVELPPHWVLLAGWMEALRRKRMHGKDGPTMIEPHSLGYERMMRGLAKRHLAWALNEHFTWELHQHCTGAGWLLRPPPEKEVDAAPPPINLDDEIPW